MYSNINKHDNDEKLTKAKHFYGRIFLLTFGKFLGKIKNLIYTIAMFFKQSWPDTIITNINKKPKLLKKSRVQRS